jgi:hypothetical protein
MGYRLVGFNGPWTDDIEMVWVRRLDPEFLKMCRCSTYNLVGGLEHDFYFSIYNNPEKYPYNSL